MKTAKPEECECCLRRLPIYPEPKSDERYRHLPLCAPAQTAMWEVNAAAADESRAPPAPALRPSTRNRAGRGNPAIRLRSRRIRRAARSGARVDSPFPRYSHWAAQRARRASRNASVGSPRSCAARVEQLRESSRAGAGRVDISRSRVRGPFRPLPRFARFQSTWGRQRDCRLLADLRGPIRLGPR